MLIVYYRPGLEPDCVVFTNNIFIYVYINLCIYIYIYMYVIVCMYIYIYIYIHKKVGLLFCEIRAHNDGAGTFVAYCNEACATEAAAPAFPSPVY